MSHTIKNEKQDYWEDIVREIDELPKEKVGIVEYLRILWRFLIMLKRSVCKNGN